MWRRWVVHIYIALLMGLWGCNTTNAISDNNAGNNSNLSAAECLKEIAKVASEFENTQYSRILSDYFTLHDDGKYTPKFITIKTERNVIGNTDDGSSPQNITIEVDVKVPSIKIIPINLQQITSANCSDGSVNITTALAPLPEGLNELISALELSTAYKL